jgi:hypothetical protein
MGDAAPGPDRVLHGSAELDAYIDELERLGDALPSHIAIDPEALEQGLAQLVLTIIELLRDLMERQAVRRIEAGSLTDEEVERLGQTFMKLEERMAELKDTFGLSDEDLNIDLGPLGHLR